MTKKQREKSVAIAKDVLKHIKSVKLVTEAYLYGDFKEGDLQAQLPALYKKRACRVCALGACMLSHVGLFDNFSLPWVTSSIWDQDIKKVLMNHSATETSP